MSWREDVLGLGFTCRDLDLGEDADGPLTATLVRAPAPAASPQESSAADSRLLAGVDILYVHGWSDYFFQIGLARFFMERGAAFYALDLRRCGRSLRPGQTPGYIDDLADYDTEIGLALAEIAAAAPPGPRRLLLLGHSTGGLILSLWASRHRGQAQGLLLNSPWLEFQLSSVGRRAITPLVGLNAHRWPRDPGPQLDYGYYTRAQRAVGPEEEMAGVNAAWRPEQAHRITAGWLQAVLAGHAQVRARLELDVPALVLLSRRYAVPRVWSPELLRADTVLEVDEVAQASLRLGDSVTVERIDGALHDVFLSAEGARAEAYRRLDRWLIGWRAVMDAEAAPSAG